MGALPRPDLPAGPLRDLNDALHDLHHRAGWPSLRVLARDAGCSHTTVSAVFSAPRLPTWGTLELLVEAMDGDTSHFHVLWLAASAPDGPPAGATPRIAGRREELVAVRRHLETGTGLLLVTGDAGIGKTTLVMAAAGAADGFVAAGRCLPLSTEVPLLPVADALRSVQEHHAQWFAEALADCPAYVAATLPRLLPELSAVGEPAAGAGSLVHLFSAVIAVLERLSRHRPLTVLLEDLHWADLATLDLVEQLASRAPAQRVVGTYRLDDGAVPAATEDWFARTRRLPGTRSIELAPLSLRETADQIRLMTGTRPDDDRVERIHARAAGHPLFTEQLAAQTADADLPRLLVDVLDRRLGVLAGAEWAVTRALGLADRGLHDDVLRTATALSHDVLVGALHELHARRLVVPDRAEVRLSHPLLAEAVRRRAMPGEAAEGHRRLAVALAASPDASAGEIARHWQLAGDRAEELVWRIAAAREAAQRVAAAQEAGHWLRALELWPDDAEHGTPELTRTGAAFRAMDALKYAGQTEQADVLAVSLLAQVEQLEPRDAAEVLAVAGDCEAALRSAESGLRLIERSVAVLESLGPSLDLVVALRILADHLVDTGRLTDGAAVHERAWQVNRAVGDVAQERALMAERAWHSFEAGLRQEALDTVAAAWLLKPPTPDPYGDVTLAKHHADLLLEAGSATGDVVAAARRGLAVAEECAIETSNVAWLRYDLGVALARSGDLRAASELIDPLTEEDVSGIARQPLHMVRADLDLRRGRLTEARTRIKQAQDLHPPSIDMRNRWCGLQAELDFWEGRCAEALDALVPLLEELVDLDEVVYAAEYFVLSGRVAAGLARGGRSPAVAGVRLGQRLLDLRARAVHDPVAQHGGYLAAWHAELARLHGTDDVSQWTRAASEWDRLGRVHDAAYSRWRAGQAALRQGQASAAAKLLKRAARDAREHLPLAAAISETAAYAQGP